LLSRRYQNVNKAFPKIVVISRIAGKPVRKSLQTIENDRKNKKMKLICKISNKKEIIKELPVVNPVTGTITMSKEKTAKEVFLPS